MKNFKYILFMFVSIFAFSFSVNALSISADGEWHYFDGEVLGVKRGRVSKCTVDNSNYTAYAYEGGCRVKSNKASSESGSFNLTVLSNYNSISDTNTVSVSATASITKAEEKEENKGNVLSNNGKNTTGDSFKFCDVNENPGVLGAFKLASFAIDLAKIAVPIILIIFGMIDLSKAVVDAKDDSIKKSALQFGTRMAVGVLIFFVPTIILLIFDNVDKWDGIESKFSPCLNCLLDYSKCPENVSIGG